MRYSYNEITGAPEIWDDGLGDYRAMSPAEAEKHRLHKTAESQKPVMPQYVQPVQKPKAPQASGDDRAAWFAVAMNAAANLEDAACCLRDPDAKASAIGAAEHVREKCNAMWADRTLTAEDHTLQLCQGAAVKTLLSLGYKWNGGEYWEPPIGERKT